MLSLISHACLQSLTVSVSLTIRNLEEETICAVVSTDRSTSFFRSIKLPLSFYWLCADLYISDSHCLVYRTALLFQARFSLCINSKTQLFPCVDMLMFMF
ncbi:hypothetical protein F2P56_036314 [Juglans regia]|uniref:Uncharacterized protein n=1 Tax=Juglans regia TaxID=51240 RepID=A0A833WSY2_JUGRE|nr:hypothetical protein F2P56_036314 [Juglans regia]